MQPKEIKIYNHETDETIIVYSLEELIEFLNATDDVFSYHLDNMYQSEESEAWYQQCIRD